MSLFLTSFSSLDTQDINSFHFVKIRNCKRENRIDVRVCVPYSDISCLFSIMSNLNFEILEIHK